MKLGIIGGSGLYEIEGMKKLETISVKTPFGKPSDNFIFGKLHGTETIFLPRHGKNHTILPGELNHRANIFGMKKLGVTHIISISAVGSLKEELPPKDVVIPDQYFDRTKNPEAHTFFGRGIVGHISFGHPVCEKLSSLAFDAANTAIKESAKDGSKPKVRKGGTYVNMEGPAFSTKAESLFYKSCGFDVIGMTNLAEAKLAREAEICYCTVAMVTDYDCWHPEHDHVTVEMIISNFKSNVQLAKHIISQAVKMSDRLSGECSCHSALAGAVITPETAIPEKLKKELAPIIGKYIPASSK